ncbi:MAG: hypothetical protein WA789_01320 [Candidatus Acidiferrum sp.]
MQQSPRARFLIGASLVLFSGSLCPSRAQQPPGPQQPAPLPAVQSSSQATQAKKSPVGPAAPQSTHFPILLLIEGKDNSWSLRIGQKGPERLDRIGYPPIPLEPDDVVREGATDAWTYNAKDSQTEAAVTIHLTREPCVDNASTTKYGFSATVDHAQVGSLQGCARVATELFPRINNQPTDDQGDDVAKDKPVPPTVTHFKPPGAVAYITATDKLVVKRGSYSRAVTGKVGYSLCLSHDGKKLLFVRDEEPSPLRTINEYDFETRRVTELIRANAIAPFWSPDDSRIAFLENVAGKWQVWSMPADAPEKAAPFYSGEEVSLYGWADTHTILASDLQNLSWIGDDGSVKQALSSADLYGKDQFSVTSGNAVRIHPLNPDLLLVSAELLPAAAAAASKEATSRQAADKEAAGKETTKDTKEKPVTILPGPAFYLYEIRSKRRVLLSPPNMLSSGATWSDDGLQIFFTGRDSNNRAETIYRMFWDGTSQIKVHDGYDFVIGQ